MTNSKQIYQDTLSQIKSEGLYKKERTITTPQRVGIITKEGGDVLNFVLIIILVYQITSISSLKQKVL